MARGTQPEPPTNLLGADKAQNDGRLASKVGHRVTPVIVRCPSFDSYPEGVRRPSLRESWSLGWMAHSESSIDMVWGFVWSSLSFFFMGMMGLWMKALERQAFKVALHLTEGSTPSHPLLLSNGGPLNWAALPNL